MREFHVRVQRNFGRRRIILGVRPGQDERNGVTKMRKKLRRDTPESTTETSCRPWWRKCGVEQARRKEEYTTTLCRQDEEFRRLQERQLNPSNNRVGVAETGYVTISAQS